MSRAEPPTERRLAAIGLRLIATVLGAVMFGLAKLLQTRGVNLLEVVFFRQLLAALLVLAIVLAGPGLRSLKTSRPMAHISRTVLGTTGMILNFGTVALLPLAETQTLWFTVPMFAVMLSALFLGERVGLHRWGAVVVGFIGVLVVVLPDLSAFPVDGAMIGLAGAFVAACVMILVRGLGRTEAALTTVFWFCAISAGVMALGLPWFLGSHSGETWALLIAMGVTGGMGQLAITGSLRLAPVSVTAPVDYAALIWSTAIGALLFGAYPTVWTLAGAAIIVASGLYIVWREHRLHRTTVAAIQPL